ncbi:MAG: phytoene desaturase family protein [Flavobacteriales bacterium]|nr:phytoene desaturase family protein [Flavobacteriales bacterium]MDW8431340.1 phytoene desaturase family protein [Flavobacteriales bacterium]
MTHTSQVLIIGSGLGALATALRLTAHGFRDILIVEKADTPGGRLNILEQDGFRFDTGPSFFSMSYEFDELFQSCQVPNPLTYRPLDPLYTVYLAGHSRPFRIFRDLKRLEKEFEGLESGLSSKMQRWLDNAGAIFHDTEHRVVKRDFDTLPAYLWALAGVPWKHAPRMFMSMWKDLENHFSSEEARVIFSLVSFFLGNTPFDTPAVYKLLSYTEFVHDGYWSVEGSMYDIVNKIVGLLKERGVRFEFRTEIAEPIVENGRLKGFRSTDGRRFEAEICVSNSDAAAFRGLVMGRRRWHTKRLDRMEWTLAPFTMYVGLNRKLHGLNHHNYFLGSNFRQYADTIFKSSVAPEKPYYYVNIPSKSDPSCAPEGCENLFFLCPVPDLRFKPDWSDAEALGEAILSDFESRVGQPVREHVVTKTIWSPKTWEQKFNLYRGSGLGLAHGLNQIGGFRPAIRDEEFDNLFYVGASTRPGTGLPMVVISSRLAAGHIVENFQPSSKLSEKSFVNL